MKKLMIALVAVAALLTTVGCDTKTENEKKADKIENSMDKSVQVAIDGNNEYIDAVNAASDLSALSMEQLQALRDKYASARAKLASGRTGLAEAVNEAERNKDKVVFKGNGKQETLDLITVIDKKIEDIDYRLKIIDNHMKERN